MTSLPRTTRFDLNDDSDHKSSQFERDTTNKSRAKFLKPIEPNIEQHITLGKSLNIPNPHCDHRDQQKAQQRSLEQNTFSDQRFNSTTYIQDLTRQIEQVWRDNEYKQFHCTPFKRLLRTPLMQYALENNLLPDRIQKRLDNDIKSQSIRNLINYLSRGKNCSNNKNDVEFTAEQLSQRYNYVDSEDDDTNSRNPGDDNGDGDDRRHDHKATNNRSIHLSRSDRFAVLSDDNRVKAHNQGDHKDHIQHRKSWATIAATSAHPNNATIKSSQSNPQPRPRTVFHAHHVDSASLLPETAIDHFTERQEGKEQQDRIKQVQAAELQWKTQINRQQMQHKAASQTTHTAKQSSQSSSAPNENESPQNPSGTHPNSTDNEFVVKPGGISFEVPIPSKLTKAEQQARQVAFEESLQQHQHPLNQRDNLVHFLHFQHDLAHSLLKFRQDSNKTDLLPNNNNNNKDGSTLTPHLPQTNWTLNDLKYVTLLLNKNKAHYLYAIRLRNHLHNDHHDVTNDEIDYDAGEIDSLLDEYWYNQQRIREIVEKIVPHLPPTTEKAPDQTDHCPSDIYDKDFYNYAELLDNFPQLEEHEPQHVLHDADTPIIMYNSCYKARYADPEELGLVQDDHQTVHPRSDAEQHTAPPAINPDAQPFIPPSDYHFHSSQPTHYYSQPQHYQPYFHHQPPQYWNRPHPPRSRRYQQPYYQQPYHHDPQHWQYHNYYYPQQQQQQQQLSQQNLYYPQHDPPNKDMILLSVEEYHRLLKNQGGSTAESAPSTSTPTTAPVVSHTTINHPPNPRDQPYRHSSRRASHDSHHNQHYYQQQLPNTGDIYHRHHMYPVTSGYPQTQRPSSGASTSSIGVDGLTRKERRKQWYRNYLEKHPDEKNRFLQDHYFKKQHAAIDKTQAMKQTDGSQSPRRRASLYSIENPDYFQDNEDFCIF